MLRNTILLAALLSSLPGCTHAPPGSSDVAYRQSALDSVTGSASAQSGTLDPNGNRTYVVDLPVRPVPGGGGGSVPTDADYGQCAFSRIAGTFANPMDAAELGLNSVTGYFQLTLSHDAASIADGYDPPEVSYTCLVLDDMTGLPTDESGKYEGLSYASEVAADTHDSATDACNPTVAETPQRFTIETHSSTTGFITFAGLQGPLALTGEVGVRQPNSTRIALVEGSLSGGACLPAVTNLQLLENSVFARNSGTWRRFEAVYADAALEAGNHVLDIDDSLGLQWSFECDAELVDGALPEGANGAIATDTHWCFISGISNSALERDPAPIDVTLGATTVGSEEVFALDFEYDGDPVGTGDDWTASVTCLAVDQS